MRPIRIVAMTILMVVCVAALFSSVLAPFHYNQQFREIAGSPPVGKFLFGTDALGRDRFSRLLFATGVSILLAPAAAAVSVGLAILISMLSIVARRTISIFTTICLALPWIFVFMILRAELPLNTSPTASILITFGLMGIAGWAWPARIFAASIGRMETSGWLLHARACGVRGWRIALIHGWPHLRAVAIAQFAVLIPAYILAEASLGLLGLGVAEPLPSWGNLLRDLQHPDMVRANPWILAPLALLVIVMVCLEALESTTLEAGEIL